MSGDVFHDAHHNGVEYFRTAHPAQYRQFPACAVGEGAEFSVLRAVLRITRAALGRKRRGTVAGDHHGNSAPYDHSSGLKGIQRGDLPERQFKAEFAVGNSQSGVCVERTAVEYVQPETAVYMHVELLHDGKQSDVVDHYIFNAVRFGLHGQFFYLLLRAEKPPGRFHGGNDVLCAQSSGGLRERFPVGFQRKVNHFHAVKTVGHLLCRTEDNAQPRLSLPEFAPPRREAVLRGVVEGNGLRLPPERIQPLQRVALHRRKNGGGKRQSLAHLGSDFFGIIRRAACLAENFLRVFLTERRFLCLLRTFACHGNGVSFTVAHFKRGRGAFVRRGEFYGKRKAAEFCFVQRVNGVEQLGRRGNNVVLGARAEHDASAPSGEIAVGKAGAGEYRRQLLRKVGRHFALVAHQAAGRHGGGYIFGALHASLYLNGAHTHRRKRGNVLYV